LQQKYVQQAEEAERAMHVLGERLAEPAFHSQELGDT
jgi:hypothetical protein